MSLLYTAFAVMLVCKKAAKQMTKDIGSMAYLKEENDLVNINHHIVDESLNDEDKCISYLRTDIIFITLQNPNFNSKIQFDAILVLKDFSFLHLAIVFFRNSGNRSQNDGLQREFNCHGKIKIVKGGP